ncbi:MAG: type III-B CRISPR module-associated Cmr3 family protein [bacterium]|nr:type III-B CRISPR module-associated Cmr3 family protein [bacterium]
MTDKTNYLVTIQPIDRYFFGTEKGFLPADGSKSNYLVRSSKLPQQTTLLGMLRYALLKKLIQIVPVGSSKLTNDELVGSSSFNANAETSFGIIDSISPLILMKGEESLIPAGFDKQFYKDAEKKVIEFSFEEDNAGQFHLINDKNTIPKIKEYDHKQNNKLNWQNLIGAIVDEDIIFGICSQAGNKKNGESLEDAFYRQDYCYLKEDFKMGMYVSLNEAIEDGSFLGFLGGDGSEFKFTFKKIENPHFPLFEIQSDEEIDDEANYKLTLLSDSKIEQSQLNTVQFAINRIVEFRHLNTTSTITNWSQINTKSNESNEKMITKSKKIFLHEKGSVFYIKGNKLLEFTKYLKNQKAFRTIGFNYYKTEKI